MTYISNNLHDCVAKEKQRAALARQVAEYERRHGPVKTIPPQRRSPDTRVDLVINAKSLDCGKKADGKHNERNAARMTIPAVKPDHGHPITLIMLNHAQRKLRVKKADIAIELKCSPSYVSNVFNGKSRLTISDCGRFFRRCGNCRLKQPRPTRNDRPNPSRI